MYFCILSRSSVGEHEAAVLRASLSLMGLRSPIGFVLKTKFGDCHEETYHLRRRSRTCLFFCRPGQGMHQGRDRWGCSGFSRRSRQGRRCGQVWNCLKTASSLRRVGGSGGDDTRGVAHRRPARHCRTFSADDRVPRGVRIAPFRVIGKAT